MKIRMQRHVYNKLLRLSTSEVVYAYSCVDLRAEISFLHDRFYPNNLYSISFKHSNDIWTDASETYFHGSLKCSLCIELQQMLFYFGEAKDKNLGKSFTRSVYEKIGNPTDYCF